MRELAELQRRFYAIATGIAPIEDAADVIAADYTRIGIYRRMYRDRLVDAIAEDYPKLVALLGDRWPVLASEYLHACPPADPDIHHAGRRLPEFLASRGLSWETDLAHLEQARAAVFFGKDTAPLARVQLEALDPAEFPSVRLGMVAARTLVEMRSNADDLWSAAEDGAPPPAPSSASRAVLVWRRGPMTVVHRTLDDDEVACIRLLASGTTFSEICESLWEGPETALRATALLLRWIDAELLAARPHADEPALTGCAA